MTHTIPLPPLPDITTLATRHPVLAHIAATLADLPDTRPAMYEDSPYVTPARLAEARR